MSNKFDLPEELLHLVEKREQPDRRAANSEESADPTSTNECSQDELVPPQERRSGQDRRTS